MINHLIVYVLSFIAIWIGSGLAIRSVEKLSGNLKISSFVVSFLILGLFTSISELSVGVISVAENDPEIYVGNLIGATIVIFMLVIPLLAVLGNSIHINPEFRGINLPLSLIVIALPVLLAIDGVISLIDSYISLGTYMFLIVSIQSKRGFIDKFKNISTKSGVKISKELIKIFFGVVIIFVASRFVVDKTLYFSNLLHISPFLISLILISLGTNVPELSLAIRSVFMRNNQVAFGDYVGSAAFNTFLLGVLTISYGKPVLLTNSYLVSLSFLVVGLLIFYWFSKTKNTISRLEGFALIAIYALFLLTEFVLHKDVLY